MLKSNIIKSLEAAIKNHERILLELEEERLEDKKTYLKGLISGFKQSLVIVKGQKMQELMNNPNIGLILGLLHEIDQSVSSARIEINKGKAWK